MSPLSIRDWRYYWGLRKNKEEREMKNQFAGVCFFNINLLYREKVKKEKEKINLTLITGKLSHSFYSCREPDRGALHPIIQPHVISGHDATSPWSPAAARRMMKLAQPHMVIAPHASVVATRHPHQILLPPLFLERAKRSKRAPHPTPRGRSQRGRRRSFSSRPSPSAPRQPQPRRRRVPGPRASREGTR